MPQTWCVGAASGRPAAISVAPCCLVQAQHAQLDLVLAGQVQALVRMPVLVLAPLHFVERVAALGPRAHFAVAIPEVGRQFGRAGVEQAEIVERAVVLVVLGDDAVDARLDAQVDVLGDQDDRAIGCWSRSSTTAARIWLSGLGVAVAAGAVSGSTAGRPRRRA